jgi:hypothetical protein
MSFHQKAFLVWLALMMSVGTAAFVAARMNPVEIKGGGIEQLIDATQAHAKALRDGAAAADDHGSRTAEEEAERWERLAGAARAELSALQP